MVEKVELTRRERERVGEKQGVDVLHRTWRSNTTAHNKPPSPPQAYGRLKVWAELYFLSAKSILPFLTTWHTKYGAFKKRSRFPKSYSKFGKEDDA